MASTDFAARAISDSPTCFGLSSSSAHTDTAAARSKVPAKTDNRAHITCSVGVQRSWLHSIAARSVWCRGSPARLPPVSTWNRSSSLLAI